MGGKYIEALLSTAILSILTIPIILTMQVGVRNANFANMTYDSVILADSLLIEVSNSLFIMENPKQEIQIVHNNSALIVDLFGVSWSDFDDRYKTDTFNYFLRIDGYDFLTGEIKLGYSFTCGNIENEYNQINYNFWIYDNDNFMQENISVVYSGEDAILTITSTEREILQLMITVEIYDKDYNILNTIFRPIMIY